MAQSDGMGYRAASGAYNWLKDALGFGNNQPAYGSVGNPSNYVSGPDAAGFGGAGQIFGGGMVPLTGLNLPYFQQDRDRLSNTMQGQSPFAGNEWGALISQLQQRSAGAGPSIAGDAYRSAAMDTQNSLGSMARSAGTPAAARQAVMQQQRVGQGMAEGYAQARNQEMVSSQAALAQTLGARDQLNQNAYLNLLAQQLGLSEGQLRAGIANQQYNLGMTQTQNQFKGAKMAALASFAGGAGKLFGGP